MVDRSRRLSFTRTALVALVALAAAGIGSTATGCATGDEARGGDEKTVSDIAALSSAMTITGTQYLGKLGNGQTRTAPYTSKPKFRSYGFQAKGGDRVSGFVSAAGGDAIAWITDDDYRVLASNDDATSDSLDALVTYTVPDGQASHALRLVFREYHFADAEFTSRLIVEGSGVCSYNGQKYNPGNTFDSVDGCNTCSCDPSGAVSCSKLTCDCNPAREPWHTYYGTPLQCVQIVFVCPAGEHPFTNTCGCGCERPH